MNTEPQFTGSHCLRWNRVGLLMLLLLCAWVTTGCAGPAAALFSPTRADGWGAQPIAINHRFTPDAALDPATGAPVGDEGYYLHVLISANDWDFRDSQSFVVSFIKHPAGHTWLILESPEQRLEYGHAGNYGVLQPRYHEGVIQRLRDGDANPIAYIWQTMPDGQFEVGNPGHDPTFVWRMPITRRAYQRIHKYTMDRKYDQFSLSTYNCGELVTKAAALAGINLTSMTRLTFPSKGQVQGHNLLVWTDPRYRVFEIRSMDVLEADLRHLARLGIGSDATAEYLASKPYPPLRKFDSPPELWPAVSAQRPRP